MKFRETTAIVALIAGLGWAGASVAQSVNADVDTSDGVSADVDAGAGGTSASGSVSVGGSGGTSGSAGAGTGGGTSASGSVSTGGGGTDADASASTGGGGTDADASASTGGGGTAADVDVQIGGNDPSNTGGTATPESELTASVTLGQGVSADATIDIRQLNGTEDLARLDVNGDGFVDGNDDFNADGTVNGADLALVALDVNGDGRLTMADDTNGDGIVNSGDIASASAASRSNADATTGAGSPVGALAALSRADLTNALLNLDSSEVVKIKNTCDEVLANAAAPERERAVCLVIMKL